MKKNYIITAACLALGLLLCSCQKQEECLQAPQKEYVLQLSPDPGIEIINDTKASASAISTVAGAGSLYWAATTGSADSETAKYTDKASTAVTAAASIATGKYMTASPTTYNWYVSNRPLTVSSSTTITASNNLDVICGRASSNSATPSVTLNHIFARTGSLTLNAPSGYTVEGVSWTLVSKGSLTGTAGTYNVTTGAWTARSAALASTGITGTSDLYLIPGVYTLTVSFTLARANGYSNSFTQSADITLMAGRINNVTANVTITPAVAVAFTVGVTAWTSGDVTGSFQ